MNTPDLLATAQRLQQQGAPFALVSVLRVELPASARPGDKAIVNADGLIQGWIGGGCTQPAVQKAVRLALADGRARVIRIAPTSETNEPRDLGEVLEFGMSCHSGGTVELFVDPIVPPARLVIIGASPVAMSLAQLAPRVGFAVTVVAQGAVAADWPDADQVLADDDAAQAAPGIVPGSWVVVATQGRRDVQGLRLALALQARQVSFVASARKAGVLRHSLVAGGADADAVAAIVAPAGYPMAATTPQEIALSVLAAVVAHRRGAPVAAKASRPEAGDDAVDKTGAASAGLPVAVEAGAANETEPLRPRSAVAHNRDGASTAKAQRLISSGTLGAPNSAVSGAAAQPLPEPALTGGCCGGGAVQPAQADGVTTLSVSADEAAAARDALAQLLGAPKSCCGG
jgi:xanthine dehydrogenase accessory factor